MYKEDKQWKWILDIIYSVSNTVNKDSAERLFNLYFIYWNNLIYYINDVDEHKYLCISVCFEKKIFELVYDWQHHDEFHHIYDWIFSSLFLQYFTK